MQDCIGAPPFRFVAGQNVTPSKVYLGYFFHEMASVFSSGTAPRKSPSRPPPKSLERRASGIILTKNSPGIRPEAGDLEPHKLISVEILHAVNLQRSRII